MRASSVVCVVLFAVSSFVLVAAPPAHAAVRPMVAAGESHSVGLRSNGTVVAVGSNASGQCDVSSWSRIAQISANGKQTIGLACDGTVVATGYNGNGECDVWGWSDIVAVAAGYSHTVGLKSNGTVVAVGRNASGQCDVSSWEGIVAVAAGNAYTIGLRSDGTVIAAGANDVGQCNVAGWRDIVDISAKHQHTLGLRSDGTVIGAGQNSFGQLNVSSWGGLVAVAAGNYHSVGVRSNGTAVAVGRFGTGVTTWAGISQVAAGADHTVAVKSDGTVVATGLNTNGQCNVSAWRLAVDVSLPVTMLSTDAAPPPDSGGWYATSPWITLATDVPAAIGYKWDDAEEFEDYDIAALASHGLGITIPSQGVHTLHFRADDGCGNVEVTRSIEFKLDMTPPSTPRLTLENLSAGSVRLRWQDATDHDGSGVARYHVYAGDDTASLATTLGPGIDLSGVEPGARFRVRAIDRAGNVSAHSDSAQVTLPPLTVTPVGPGIPGGAVAVSFPSVWTSGTTQASRVSLPTTAPAGFELLVDACFDIRSTATFHGESPTVTLAYDDAGLTAAQERSVRLYHLDGSTWTDITSSVDLAGNTVSGVTSSFSPFAVMYQPAEAIVSTPASSSRSLALTVGMALAVALAYRRRGGLGTNTGVEAL